MIDESTARSLTAHWISPADTELCRFATGHDCNPGSVVDWNDFLAELDACGRFAVTAADYAELDSIREYALYRLNGAN